MLKRKAKTSDVYCTSFCSHGHRLSDGKPVAHECYVLHPDDLRAEQQGKPLPDGMRTGKVMRGKAC